MHSSDNTPAAAPALHVRPALPADLPALMPLFDAARAFMRAAGNMVQWVGGYPSAELMADEITAGHCFAITTESGRVCATFCLIAGDDPTYAHIEGAWLHPGPYCTIHRLASDGSARGVFAATMAYARSLGLVVRADTHESNANMQRLLLEAGFEYCGIIYVADGTPRLAYSLAPAPRD